MRAYNNRLKYSSSVKWIDFDAKKIGLVHNGVIYSEKLENVTLQEFSGVTLGEKKVYEGDEVTDGINIYVVKKNPGGFYPFTKPVQINFRLK